MATAIMTFYNEEYYLPWWIKHHSKLFDNGILIDYHSTDRSYEICKDLCPPHWKIVKSMYDDFDPFTLDLEFQFYESTVSGFKMPLTTAEFLFVPAALDNIDRFCIDQKVDYFRTYGVCMVDTNTEELPTYDKQLYAQKYHGMINGYIGPPYNPLPNYFACFFSRYYHNNTFGAYATGRHFLIPPLAPKFYKEYQALDIFTLKYKYSPWNPTTIARIQQFKDRIPQSALDDGKSGTHCLPEEAYISEYNHYLSTADDLRKDPIFLNAYNYCMSL